MIFEVEPKPEDMRTAEAHEYDPSWTLAVVQDLEAFFDACGMTGSSQAAAVLRKTVTEEFDGYLSTKATDTRKPI